MVACFNDPLDASKDNAEFFVHSSKPHLLTVLATKDVAGGSFGYLPYGGSFWCNTAYSSFFFFFFFFFFFSKQSIIQ
jgi:hypothetical protein